MSKSLKVLFAVTALAAFGVVSGVNAADTKKVAATSKKDASSTTEQVTKVSTHQLGRLATEDEIAAWDIDIRPDGVGLPKGKGTAAQGEQIYGDHCAVCHGDFGEATGRWPPLAGGAGTLTAERPLKTIGSYWPYLSTVYDYVRRAMPFGNARSLSNDDVYALTAFLLQLNDVIQDENFELSDKNFTSIHLPNEKNFIDDDRLSEPNYVKNEEPCMSNCKPDKAKISAHAAVLDVTPENSDDKEDGANKGGVE
ncbi:cytochrome C [Hyphomicrobium methylovorum]|uniref:c-type cytochrome n=1 Tax=Hyphomicrobium methylovorum TaxID=84 RepID=UPI0015E7D4EF|nr:cytochrome c [Hyphomicrobium methylovorum]MBA2127460.1 cytochrome C [Hyphomicrobium methylovorum]